MFKVIALTTLIFGCLSLMALQENEKSSALNQKSKNSIYQGTLDCDTKISTGTFLSCRFDIFKGDKKIKNIEVFLSGGMPAHKHGLPTAPKLIWSEEKQTYLIEGLKFSMPGEWILNFKINAVDTEQKDVISMAINVE